MAMWTVAFWACPMIYWVIGCRGGGSSSLSAATGTTTGTADLPRVWQCPCPRPCQCLPVRTAATPAPPRGFPQLHPLRRSRVPPATGVQAAGSGARTARRAHHPEPPVAGRGPPPARRRGRTTSPSTRTLPRATAPAPCPTSTAVPHQDDGKEEPPWFAACSIACFAGFVPRSEQATPFASGNGEPDAGAARRDCWLAAAKTCRHGLIPDTSLFTGPAIAGQDDCALNRPPRLATGPAGHRPET